MGEYGEPWIFAEERRRIENNEQMNIVCDCVGDDSISSINQIQPTLWQGRRVAACVSALAGIENPAAIPELIAAADELAKWPGWTSLATVPARLRSALAALGRRP